MCLPGRITKYLPRKNRSPCVGTADGVSSRDTLWNTIRFFNRWKLLILNEFFQISLKASKLTLPHKGRSGQYWQQCHRRQGAKIFQKFCKTSHRNPEWAKATPFSLYLFKGIRGIQIQKPWLYLHWNFATSTTSRNVYELVLMTNYYTKLENESTFVYFSNWMKKQALSLYGVLLNFWRHFHAILSPSVPSSGINVKYHAYNISVRDIQKYHSTQNNSIFSGGAVHTR